MRAGQRQPASKNPVLTESRETPFYSLQTRHVWGPPGLSCVLWSSLHSRGAPDKLNRSVPKGSQPGTGRKPGAGGAATPGLAWEAWEGTRAGLSTWLNSTGVSETEGHVVLRPFQFRELDVAVVVVV